MGIKYVNLSIEWHLLGDFEHIQYDLNAASSDPGERGYEANWLPFILFYQQDQGCLLKLTSPTACWAAATVGASLEAKQTRSSNILY